MKIYYNKNYFIRPCSELAILAPFEESFSSDQRMCGILNNNYNHLTDIENCDYVVMPYKWDKNNLNNDNVFEEAERHGKKVLIFHIDDSDEDINVNNSYVFRTSFYKSKKKYHEMAMPSFKKDIFNGRYLNDPELSIAFCGQVVTKIRKDVINILNSSDLKCNFLIRRVAWPSIEPGKSKEQVITEFYDNMNNNIFNLCIRGGGNFSYRLYETLMMGRVPIIIDTDIVLPFEDIIDWNKHSVICNKFNIIDKIKEFYSSNDMNEIQKTNRSFWEDYLSPKGFIEKLEKLI